VGKLGKSEERGWKEGEKKTDAGPHPTCVMTGGEGAGKEKKPVEGKTCKRRTSKKGEYRRNKTKATF